MDEDNCNTIEGNWEDNECYVACTSNETCCTTIEGNWNGNE